MEVRTRELLTSLAVTTLKSPRSRVGSLSGGQRQAVAIARSLLTRPRVVIISHNLDNVFHVADRMAVLRLGRRVANFDRRTAAREDVVAAITGGIVAPAEPLVEGVGV